MEWVGRPPFNIPESASTYARIVEPPAFSEQLSVGDLVLLSIA